MAVRGMSRVTAVALIALVAQAAAALGVPRDAGAAAPACTLAGVVATWPVRRLAEQTLVVPVQETNVGAVSAEVAAGAGGVILFGHKAPSHLASKLRTLVGQAPHGIAPLVMTDEEGGAVQRMPNLVGSMPSARTMAATMTRSQIRTLATKVGSRMRKVGVTMNLAPVLDLDNGPGPSRTDPIGTRSFSLSVRTTTGDGLAFARGMRAGGEMPTVKHFPGLGQATGNTDLEPASTKRWSYLKTHGLLPFVSAINAGLPAVMVTNARVPGLTKLPATLSRAVVQGELRRRLGFHRLVLTDSLSAGAISGAGYQVSAASVRAVAVGADMVLFGATPDLVAARTRHVVRALVNAVATGALPRSRLQSAVVHVLRAKRVNLCS